jgi:hypothetical protein
LKRSCWLCTAGTTCLARSLFVTRCACVGSGGGGASATGFAAACAPSSWNTCTGSLSRAWTHQLRTTCASMASTSAGTRPAVWFAHTPHPPAPPWHLAPPPDVLPVALPNPASTPVDLGHQHLGGPSPLPHLLERKVVLLPLQTTPTLSDRIGSSKYTLRALQPAGSLAIQHSITTSTLEHMTVRQCVSRPVTAHLYLVLYSWRVSASLGHPPEACRQAR